ncbi:hypothetical protein F5Y13DRAFT_98225 [Hypoxylon sp. FL1857]|nr:hypothetical protein F5Y13DRAFT_98225 [Hypoxylon sp. FL1857]
MATTASLHNRLDCLYDVWMSLKPDSPETLFAKFANYFDENCTAYLLSMREIAEPSIGREGVIKGIKEVIKNTRITKRNVVDSFDITQNLSRTSTASGSKISVEMSNDLDVRGKKLDSFPEVAVVTFNCEGLITNFKLYCCRSPIVHIIQDVTGEGPYKVLESKCH